MCTHKKQKEPVEEGSREFQVCNVFLHKYLSLQMDVPMSDQERMKLGCSSLSLAGFKA
jgi:hypothetical protein